MEPAGTRRNNKRNNGTRRAGSSLGKAFSALGLAGLLSAIPGAASQELQVRAPGGVALPGALAVGRPTGPLVNYKPAGLPRALQVSPTPTVAALAATAKTTLAQVEANATAFIAERETGTLTQAQVNTIITPTVKANLTNTINTTLALTARPSPDATPEERAVLATVRAELVDFVNKTATQLNIPEIAVLPPPAPVQTYGNVWGAATFNLQGRPVAAVDDEFAPPAAEHPVVVPQPLAAPNAGIVHRGLGGVGNILGKLNPGSNTYKQVALIGVCTVVVVGTVVMLAPEGFLVGVGNTILSYVGYGAAQAAPAAVGALAPAAALAVEGAAIAAPAALAIEGAAIAAPIVQMAAAPAAAQALAAGGAGAAVGGSIDLLLQVAADYAADPAMAGLMAGMGGLALGGRRKHKSMRKRAKFAKRGRASVRSRRR
jgi:hypothetical protein